MTRPNHPLWKTMRDSAMAAIMRPAGLRATSARQEAARLRAIAEWIYKQGSLADVAARADTIKLLYDEADRAERGE